MLLVTVYTVGYVCSFLRDQIFVDFVGFLSMIIYGVSYTLLLCLRYISSTWLLNQGQRTWFLKIVSVLMSVCVCVFVCVCVSAPEAINNKWCDVA